MIRVGFIGLGEAGLAMATGLSDVAAAHVVGYDILQDEPAVRAAAEQARVQIVGSATGLAAAADVVICLTSASAAISIAEEVAPVLSSRHLYADYNSASPELKWAVAAVVEPTGARFVDGAVMAAVSPARHQVPVLASGSGAEAFAAVGRELEMRIEVIGDRPGDASAVKMFRSLLVKGLEALVLECALGGARYGVSERVFASMGGSLPFEDWEALASYLIGRTVVHGERRAEELRQVATALVGAGIEPWLAEAGAARLQWAVDHHLRERFGGVAPRRYQDVLRVLAEPGTTPLPPVQRRAMRMT